MSAPLRRGWCPSLFEPMQSGDGWLSRVKPPGAVLDATAARALATAAARYGNGTLELTSRANLQVRGLAPDGVAPFAEAVVAAGLADPDPAIERRRAVIHPPLADARFRLAAEIEAILARDPALVGLPAKFCVAVDDDGSLPPERDRAMNSPGDHACADHAPDQGRVTHRSGDLSPADRAPGRMVADLTVRHTRTGALILLAGSNLGIPLPAADVADAVRRIALGFLAMARRAASPSRRMRTLIEMIGAPAVFAASGLGPGVPADMPTAINTIGWLPSRHVDIGAVGFGAPSGAMSAATLAALADLAERFGAGEIRVTPWRTVLLPGIAAGNRDTVQAAGLALGLIVDPADRRRAIITCTGQPGCAAASVNVRADAAMLLPLDLPAPIHLSGCAKGCAHHGVAPITLVGENGRYGIIRDGNAGSTPSLHGLTMRQVVASLGNNR